MLNVATKEEGEAAATGNGGPGSSADDVALTSDMLDKFDLGSTSSLNTIGGDGTSTSTSTSGGSGKISTPHSSPAMSGVFGANNRGSAGEGGGTGSQTSSPTRKSSLTAAMFHRRSHSFGRGSTSSIAHHESNDGGNAEGAVEAGDNDGGNGDGASNTKHQHRHRHQQRGPNKRNEKDKHSDREAHRLASWLAEGNVVYKSVGLGLMDLTVGLHLVKYAQERGVGTTVQGF